MPTVLVVMPHPDDLELTCAGSVVRWVEQGDEVCVLVGTKGARGGSGEGLTEESTVRVRAREQQEAASVLGVKNVCLLDFEDGALNNDEVLRSVLVEQVRTRRPDVVVALDPLTVIYRDSYVNHRDHRELGVALLDALYPQASNALFFPEQIAAGLRPHKVPEVLLARTNSPNFWVDVSETIEKRFNALRCHRSQMGLWEEGGEAVIREQRTEASAWGAQRGVRYAEAFRRIVASPLN